MVSRTAVYAAEFLYLFRSELAVEVHLVEDNHGLDSVHLAGDQQPVQERQFDFGEVQSDHQHGPVQIGGNDVLLAGEVGAASYDVVAAREDFGDDRRVEFIRSIGIQRIDHLVAYRYRVGGPGFLQPDLAAEHCGKRGPAGEFAQQEMAAGILYDGGFHHLARPMRRSAKLRSGVVSAWMPDRASSARSE